MRRILSSLLILFAFSQLAWGQWNTDRIVNIGRNALYYEDYVLSIQYFNQAIKIKPYLHEPYMYRAMAKINLGDYIGAEQDSNEAIERNPFVPMSYYTRGFARKNLNKFDEAIADFTKALEFDPDNGNFIANRVESKERNKDYAGAIEDLKLFKRVSPKAKGIDYEIGRIMLVSNDTLGAAEMMRKNIAADSTMEMSYKLLAYIKEQKNDLDGALETLNDLKNVNPRAENLDLELGRLYLAKNDTNAALQSFDKAVAMEPRKPHAYGARGFLHLVRKNDDDALRDYSKAIEYGSEFSGDYINRGILNVKKYNFNQALNDYNYAILLDRGSSLAYYNRALLRNNLGDKNNALSDLDRVLELDPSNNEALLQQANLQLELGMLDEAIVNFEEILKNYRYFAPAYYSLAEAYEKKGNIRLANNYRSLVFEIINNRDYYKRKQNLEPKNQIVQRSSAVSVSSTEVSLADKLSSQSEDKFTKTSHTSNKIRGKVQDSYAELRYMNYAGCSFNDADSILSSTNRYHELLQSYNKVAKLNKRLYINILDKNLHAGNVQPHFDSIEELSKQIEKKKSDAYLYLARAVEFETVQDFSSALEDINKAISLQKNSALAHFVRAGIRLQLIENEEMDEEVKEMDQLTYSRLSEEKQRAAGIEILHDLDRSIELSPDFSFAYYNKANYLASVKKFHSAVEMYNQAIEIDPYFAEAYFGRALSYIFMNEEEQAKMDLSKAGELGIYRAYNLLNRLLGSKD